MNADAATSPSKANLWAFAPLIAFLAIACAAGWVLMQGGARRETVETRMIGQPMPAYAMAALQPGAPVTPAAFASQAYLVNFFASTCAPCKVEHPLLMRLKAQGAPILGVAYKDDPNAAQSVLTRDGDPYALVGLDPDGRVALEMGVSGTPETIVVGPDGMIRAFHRGALTEDVLARKILPALRR